VVRDGWTDIVGMVWMILAYPTIVEDAMEKGTLNAKAICRTFSDCTTAPRNGLISGCYPLDRYYTGKPEAAKLKEIKGKSSKPQIPNAREIPNSKPQ